MNDLKASVRIRLATPADLDAMVELENRSFVTDIVSRAQYRRHIGSASAIVLVAYAARRLVGSALIFVRKGGRRARLYSIAIAAESRGMGVGSALLKAAETAARKHGREHLYLEVRSNNDAAIGLYEARGYVRGRTLRKFYEDGSNARRYEKPLR